MIINEILSGDYLKRRSKSFRFTSIIVFSCLLLLFLFIEWKYGSQHLSIGIICTGIICFLLLIPIIILRQDELAAVFCVAVGLYVDWYLGMRIVALGLILVLLLVRYLNRSSRHTWAFPRARGFWILLLVLGIFPALRGYTLPDGITYYLTIFVVPLLIFWLGNLLAQDMTHVRRFFVILAAFCTLIAILALIQAATGKLLFSTPRFDLRLEQTSDYALFKGSSIHRVGVYFVNPDSSGTFFAVAMFIPLGLVFASSTLRLKVLYLAQVFLIVLALLFTYSTGAWIASAGALLLVLILLGNRRLRLFVLGTIVLIAAILLIFFRVQLNHQLQHIILLGNFLERFVGWQVAFRVIGAFPLTGLGLGNYAYYYRAQAFKIPDKYYIPLTHPHNSFLEITAMGGFPLGIVFLSLLIVTTWWAWHNWAQTRGQARLLLIGGTGAVTALTINTLGVNSWTLAPLAALGWLIMGVVSSPLLLQNLQIERAHKQEGIEYANGEPANMQKRPPSRSLWNTFPFPGFFKKEWDLWHQQQSQPCYPLAAGWDQVTYSLLYPLDMSPLLALPHGILDQQGVPYNRETSCYPAAYQPTTIAQYALAQWNAYLTTQDETRKEAFLTQARWLVEHEQRQGNDMGVWPIPFPAYGYTTQESWLSALTQGNIISVLVRAYKLTGNENFLQVARRALRTFELDIRAGGVNTSVGRNGLFFEEIAVYPASHILNGFIFALFGLYDYGAATQDTHVEALIKQSHFTLHTLIDGFDTGRWSRYDLYFRDLATPFYHALHIVQLQALSHYSGCQHCAERATRWATYKYRPTYFIVTRLVVYRRAFQRKLDRLVSKRSNRPQRGLQKNA